MDDDDNHGCRRLVGRPVLVTVSRDYGVSLVAAQWTMSVPWPGGRSDRPRRLPAVLHPVPPADHAHKAALLLVANTTWWQVFAMMTIAGVASGLSFAQMAGLLVISAPSQETRPAVGFSMIMRLLGFLRRIVRRRDC